jgi:ketosteroid isomerase-like protein
MTENEEIRSMRRTWSKFEAAFDGDADAFLEGMTEDVEWIPLLAVLESKVYRGREGVRAWIEELRHTWEAFAPVMEEFQDLGDGRYMALGHWEARARTSGVELQTQPASWLIQLREGKVARLQTFTDRSEALEVAERLRSERGP